VSNVYTSYRVGQLRHQEMLQRAEEQRQVRQLPYPVKRANQGHVPA